MSNQPLNDEARKIAKMFSNPLYRKVEDLARNPSGTVYDPSMAPRPDTPIPEVKYVDDSLIPGNAIVNENWEENLKRVFGQTYGDRDWKDLKDMTMKCWKRLRKQGNQNQRDTKWSMDDIERYGRLRIWGVHDDVIAALVGWTSNQEWTAEDQAHLEAVIKDELKYIPMTLQEVQANLIGRQ
ncbi:hypothetical protein FGADI_2408 [Fusarium gaditjirri]|uniref:Uncharacterized protein n=1 Tax=Fusarium gaditjirri TaxID=282569 RepID=A0A8H4TIM6_9HYPO|nr:hypothetical protein FGADI_2408 [Fusarium gaditjirri]